MQGPGLPVYLYLCGMLMVCSIAGFDTASTTVDDLYKQTPSRLWENRGPKFNLSAVEVRAKFTVVVLFNHHA